MDAPELLAGALGDLHRRPDGAGRDPPTVDVQFTNPAGGDPATDAFDAAAHLAGLEHLAAIGVTWVQVPLPGGQRRPGARNPAAVRRTGHRRSLTDHEGNHAHGVATQCVQPRRQGRRRHGRRLGHRPRDRAGLRRVRGPRGDLGARRRALHRGGGASSSRRCWRPRRTAGTRCSAPTSPTCCSAPSASRGHGRGRRARQHRQRDLDRGRPSGSVDEMAGAAVFLASGLG
jgi:hypothetical protein